MKGPGRDNRKRNERCRKTHLGGLGILEVLVEKSDDVSVWRSMKRFRQQENTLSEPEMANPWGVRADQG